MGQWISIDTARHPGFEAYLATPPTGSGPGLLLLQEAMGVNPHIRTVADQYAAEGFTVLAPDVFWRLQPHLEFGYGEAEMQKVMAAIGGLDFPLALQDIAHSIDALRARPECTGKVAALGYCMGGLLSFLTAASGQVDAAVCYYGGRIQDHLHRLAEIRIPVLMHFADQDRFIPIAAIDTIVAACAGQPALRVERYPADHGFNCPERAAYHHPSALLAKGRTLGFLARTLYPPTKE
ncbi:MAG: dienelactone hydrolase family protein [Proteobacteria bacterium]|nr:dienelactone hydrolase family protein [Pseudomonadota bacterium]HQR04894.1 dienelactone hydrolase family protein [Rhodocyclaceae bacterium]